jgi:hypothetical protein
VKHSIRFADGPEDVSIVTSGAASLDGLDAVVSSLLADVRYRPGMALLFDHRRLDWNGLQAEDLVRRLHIALMDADLIGPSRIAVVASDPRMADARALRRDEPTWRAFSSVGDGRAWLTGVGAAG